MSNRLILLACALLLALVPASLQAQVIGTNVIVRNDVKKRAAAVKTFTPAVRGERASLGDRVQTGARSYLQLRLRDKSRFAVGPNSQVTLDRFVYDPKRDASEVGASVVKGGFRFMSGKAARKTPGKSKIKTPIATIGIRGTIVEIVVGADALVLAEGELLPEAVEADPETATFIVLRGPREHKGEAAGGITVESGGKSVDADAPNLATFIPSEGAQPVEPFAISAAGLLTLQRLLEPIPVGEGDPGDLGEQEKNYRLLALHNFVRAKVGVPPLVWDDELALGALEHAQTVARTGTRDHAPREGRTARENLIWASQGSLTLEALLEKWSEEVGNFAPGVFPDVASNGNWMEIAHFTQMIWPETRELGCAHVRDQGRDALICRYLPGGNKDGVSIP